jgi:DnaJ-class molecular chaperone
MPSVQFKDYYKTLGVSKTASESEIKAAYRKLAKQFHPDRNPGDHAAEERFKEINEANEVLTDQAKRKLYDRYGDDWQHYQAAGFTGSEPRSARTSAGSSAGADDFGAWFARQNGSSTRFDDGVFQTEYRAGSGGFSDFFQTLFGGGRSTTRDSAPPRRRQGSNLEVDITVSFDEAYRGSTRTFDVQSEEICSTCGGKGYVRENPCPTCDATGRVAQVRQIEVKVPAGVATGSKIRVRGQGNPGEGGAPAGDILIKVTVQPDSRFERTGDDLRTDIDVPLYTAALGGEVVVPTPTGRIALSIPAETQSGKVFRIRGKGMPKIKGKSPDDRGDLLARARIVLPAPLTDVERKQFAELKQRREATSS